MTQSLKKLSFHAKKSIRDAETLARECASERLEPEHLLAAIYLERGSVGSLLLQKIGFREETFDILFSQKKQRAKSPKQGGKKILLSEETKNALTRAYRRAFKSGSPYVGTEHIIEPLLKIKREAIKKLVARTTDVPIPVNKQPSGAPQHDPFHFMPHFGEVTEQETEDIPSALEQFCVPVSGKASDKNSDLHVGRDRELSQLIHILGRKKKNNAILIGEPGVGKTALISGLAQRIASGDVPAFLLGKSVYELDMALLVAGTSFRGEFEDRIKSIVEEVEDDPSVILFIDEIHTISGAGAPSGGLDAANILKPALARGQLRCIGATTLGEYKKYFEKDSALARRFQTVLLDEPSADETYAILSGIRSSLEKHHGVTLPDNALRSAIEFSQRYLPQRRLPDKAIDVIDHAAAARSHRQKVSPEALRLHKLGRELDRLGEHKKHLLEAEQYEKAEWVQEQEQKILAHLRILEKNLAKTKVPVPEVTDDDIAAAVSVFSHVPADKIRTKPSKRLFSLHTELKKSVVGQDDAITKLSQSLLRTYAGLGRSKGPIGSFLLLGPTGTGKTHTARILAETLFDSPESLIRIDMSEFGERHSAAGLIGAPAGYIGYGEGGRLTEKVRLRPHSVVLFDEIEKAHPDVLNILLQILEDGTLTDTEGRSVTFSETIIVLTANIGTEAVTVPAQLGFGESRAPLLSRAAFKSAATQILSDLPKHIRPEILARLDEALMFEPLEKKHLRLILLRELAALRDTLKKRGIQFSWDTQAMALLLEKSSDGYQGARLVRKAVRDHVENMLARHLLKPGQKHSKLRLTVRGDAFDLQS